jgi:peptidoglycan L-alanyl-D-glutamate endopeptidase CwlK
MALNDRSLRNLEGVHPDLVRVVKRAAELSPMPFVVTEGLRNLERQRALKAAGKSWTLDSRHISGHAVDLVDADNFGYEMPDMTVIAKAMRQAAAELNVPIEWGANVKYGGDWKTLNDSPHFQLPKKSYPASGISTATKVKEAVTNVATSKPAVVVGTGVATGVATNPPSLPSIPAPPDLTTVSAWQTFGETVSGLVTWVGAHPVLALGIGGWIGATIFWTQIKAWFQSWRTA